MFSRLLRLFLLLWLLPSLATASQPESAPVFSFHLLGEPYTLDPLKAQGSAGSYLYSNLFRGLYKYDSEDGLVLEGAKSCKDIKNTLVCELDQRLWSNGEAITADHYVQAFRRLSDPNNKSPQLEALLSIKNAKEILASKLKPENLGITARGANTLIFEFDQADPEFRYKLTLPAMAPLYTIQIPSREKADTLVTNGPYKIRSWTKGRKIVLENNPFYFVQHSRPQAEVYFVEDDSTALNLYLTQKLTFLRRLETDKISEYKKRPDFYQVPMARFDYIGFGRQLKSQQHLRKALATSLHYEELQKLYKALGRPGCPSLPSRFQNQIHCHVFNLAQAQDLVRTNKEGLTASYDLAFSKMGGEDIQKGMEWAQHQWKKNLGVRINLKPQEQGYYIKQLQQDRFQMFRKGVGLDRPTCLAALEIFLPEHPENYIRLNDPEYINKVEELKTASSLNVSKQLCSEAIKILIDKAYIIPLGEMHFTLLARPEFKGWRLNEMNQLDLTRLSYQP